MTLGNMRELGARDENGLPLALSEPPRLSQNDKSHCGSSPLAIAGAGGSKKDRLRSFVVHAFHSASTAFTATHANTSATLAHRRRAFLPSGLRRMRRMRRDAPPISGQRRAEVCWQAKRV